MGVASLSFIYILITKSGWIGKEQKPKPPCATHTGVLFPAEAQTHYPGPSESMYLVTSEGGYRVLQSASYTEQSC
jgi:hypothetical protein